MLLQPLFSPPLLRRLFLHHPLLELRKFDEQSITVNESTIVRYEEKERSRTMAEVFRSVQFSFLSSLLCKRWNVSKIRDSFLSTITAHEWTHGFLRWISNEFAFYHIASNVTSFLWLLFAQLLHLMDEWITLHQKHTTIVILVETNIFSIHTHTPIYHISTSLNAKHVQNKAAKKSNHNRPRKHRLSDINRKPVVYPSFEKPSEYTISDAPAAPVAKKSEN